VPRICAKKEESVSIVERRERRSMRIYQGIVKKRVYQTLKFASNGTCVLCRKKG